MYSDRGTKQCGPGTGSLGHEAQDAQTFADWGADYLKEDSCAASQNHTEAFAEYARMRDGLNKTGRPIVFSLCGWEPWYAPVGESLGNLWRIGPDDTNWAGVLKNIDINAQLAQYAGPGGWNDPCLLLAQDYRGNYRITELQSRAQFSMWAVMASPLIISSNVRNMSKMNLETYSNREVIAVDQDPLGLQGTRVVGGDLHGGGSANGRPAIAAACTAGDVAQRWALRPSQAGTSVYNAANDQLLNVYDCGAKLVMWSWVTDGCDGNRGFFFNHTAAGALTAAVHPGQCLQDPAPGGQLALVPCDPASPGQRWSYDAAAQTLRSGLGRCATAPEPATPTNVWVRKLSESRAAIVFINAGSAPADVVCDAACAEATGLKGRTVQLRDLWKHAAVGGTQVLETITARALAPAGGSMMLLVTPRGP